ncbi:hypothetical protein ACFFMN_07955 [Planobispora siamensis]|uniref:Uncharacterized protein n=1 Tax=Planobispora siamensis TaxID=936338 RepID=A0A8J3WIC3_9ACTN|nr:hypothetical protein [Planobispora siamensis]GIH90423.1 hypothetical protein Psi01_10530 [Planobispora siamensis]
MAGWQERWQRSQAEVMQRDMLPAWYATRERRRVLAAAAVFALALGWVNAVVAWVMGPTQTQRWIVLTLLVVMMVVYLPAVTLMNVATRGVTALAERQLDERQRGERLRAVALSHRTTTVILALLAVVFLVNGMAQGRGHTVSGSAMLHLFLALALTHFVLPLIVSCWRLPDPPPDDDD